MSKYLLIENIHKPWGIETVIIAKYEKQPNFESINQMGELTDEEIKKVYSQYFDVKNCDWLHLQCIRAILQKASKK
jgi:hypothetical protein